MPRLEMKTESRSQPLLTRRFLLWILALILLAAVGALLLALPLRAEEPQAPVSWAARQSNLRQAAQVPVQSDWNNLQRLPMGARLVIEDIDGKRHGGALIAVAEDAISLGKRKTVIGITRFRVERVWLVGDTKVGEGAGIGAVLGALLGAVLGGVACAQGGDNCGWVVGYLAFFFGGGGAGIGAAIGSGARERSLIYQAPPSWGRESTSLPPAATRPIAMDSLPAPMQQVYRVFSIEEAGREAARDLARANQ